VRFEGIHHITLITGDAPRNVDFYTRVLGLRLVKKTVNQDDPTVYHLFYADEEARPGADITFFEYPQARRGQPGAGMVHTIVYRVGSGEALDFWAERLRAEGLDVERPERTVAFRDPEGVRFELRHVETDEEPLVARHPEIPRELALQGFEGVRAYSASPGRSRTLLEDAMGFEPLGDDAWVARGAGRSGWIAYDPPPDAPGRGGAGTVHHVAWGSLDADHEAWRQRIAQVRLQPTPVIDRFWFRSVYFREPSGVLFELATMGPGFAVDEDPEHLGEALILPPAFEHLRERIEPVLTPLPDPRASWSS